MKRGSLIVVLVLAFVLANCGQPSGTVSPVQTSPNPAPTRTAHPLPTRLMTEESATVTVTASRPDPSPTVAAAATATATEAVTQPVAFSPARAGAFSREQLIADARQLARIIENTHPDPYIRGGGKVAFHLRLHNLLNAIPAQGASRDVFIQLLRPFIAAIGDSHTEIWSDYMVNESHPGGVPLRFGIVEQSLYVAGVLRSEDQGLIGSLLLSVEGVPLSELLARQRALVPLENIYHELENMTGETLWYGPYLRDVLPEWGDEDEITVTLQRPTGEVEDVTFSLPVLAGRTYWPATQIDLPTTPSYGFRYAMLNPPGAGEELAYLRVDHMQRFREDVEAIGESGRGIPSVTETFRDMVIEMAAAGAETLIIDLRGNVGGSSLMADILIYFLYGKEGLHVVKTADFRAGGQVNRYSALCFTRPNNIGTTLAELNLGREIPFELGDYDFRWFYTGDPDDYEQYLAQMDEPGFVEWYRRTPTFFDEYESELYSGYYLPAKVVVLVSPWTFSSGFTMTRLLYHAGATLVGTPASQSSNTFGNGLLWRLDNTGLEGQINRSYFVLFPEDSGLGRVLPVAYPLSYEKLVEYDFDPNAAFFLALELLPSLGE